MYIKSVKLINFRNHKEKTINFINGINIITGDNAVGKTNIAEALYYTSLAKSPRTISNDEMINFDSFSTYFKVIYNEKNKDKNIEIYFDRNKEKLFKINSLSTKSIRELVGNLKIVYFSPEEIKIVKDGPIERRRFIDICLCQLDKKYLINQQNYKTKLDNRNKILKTEDNIKNKQSLLDIWDDLLISDVEYIIKERYKFIEKFSPILSAVHKKLSNNKEIIELKYNSSFKKEDNYKEIKNKYLKSREKDILFTYTNLGPHRDDIDIIINNISESKKFLSQGQQRTVTLSFKIAEALYIQKECKEKPILILDDVLSELDKKRTTKLMKYINNFQTIITSTNNKNIEKINEIKIKN